MSDFLNRWRSATLYILVFSPVVLFSQSFRAYEKAGDRVFQSGDYYAAMVHFADALEIKPENTAVTYKYAESARQFNSFDVAADYYLKVLESNEGNTYPLARYWLAYVYQQMGLYDQALLYYQYYIDQATNKEPAFAELAQQGLDNCKWAKELMEHPDDIKIEPLNKKVNTGYSEFGAYLRKDTLYYSSYRFENSADNMAPPRKISRVLTSVRGGKGRQIRRGFNADTLNTAHVTFSQDGKRIYFTLCNYTSATAIRCQLYYREKDKRKRWQKKPTKLPASINKKEFTSTQPSIGYDSILQKEILYFVSDRTGGKGGLDIWYSVVEKGDNQFTEPQPLEWINTPLDDISPYYETTRQQLYFSSQGHQNLGGHDIYRWAKDSQVVHMGFPLNSSYNDIYFSPKPGAEVGYFSSNRPGARYLDQANKSCCYDIFAYEVIPPVEVDSSTTPEIDTPTEPSVVTTPDPPVPVAPEEKVPTALEDFLPLALYFDNDEPDKRTRRTTTKKTYGSTFDKYYDRKPDYLTSFIAPVEEEDKAEAESAVETFFEEDVKKGFDYLIRFSEILLKRLEKGETVEIFVKGFTSPRAKSDYNLSLSKRRVSSVRNHFDTYKDGIFLPYLANQKLTITERSFGESQASNQVSDALDDQRNSIYHPDAARERRVEIQEIKSKE